jgi:MFS transporter, DHA2 family, multidrug resistance protein
MAGSVVDGVPREAAAAAQDTLGGAVAAAGQLRGLGAALLDTARKAFTQGLQVTAITSALVVMGMAILVMVSLRHVRSASELDVEETQA